MRLHSAQWCGRQRHDESFDLSLKRMAEVVDRAATQAKTKHLWDAKRGSQDLLDAHVAHQREQRRKTLESVIADDVKSKVQLVGSAKRTRWPTRLSLKLHLASSDLALRERAEKQERERERDG